MIAMEGRRGKLSASCIPPPLPLWVRREHYGAWRGEGKIIVCILFGMRIERRRRGVSPCVTVYPPAGPAADDVNCPQMDTNEHKWRAGRV